MNTPSLDQILRAISQARTTNHACDAVRDLFHPASIPTVTEFPNGLTVKELKALVKDWPETDRVGDDREVWIAVDDQGSYQVKRVWPLNAEYASNSGGSTTMSSADILLEAKS